MTYSTFSKDLWFGHTEEIYDTETLTRTVVEISGSYENTYVQQMTKEQMLTYAKNREVMELRNYEYEMKKLQESYEEKLAEIRKFQKALDI